MKPTPRHLRAPFVILLVAFGLAATLGACQPGMIPEAGIDRAVFQDTGASLAINPRGYWFAIAPAETVESDLANYVVIEHDGHTALFYAAAPGRRTAQLLPLGPVDSRWFSEAVEADATPIFVDDLGEVELSEPVGIWDGEASSEVHWHGPAPAETVEAVVVPALAPAEPVGLGGWAQGVATVEDARVSHTAGAIDTEQAPFLLLPEKHVTSASLEVVDLSGGAAELEDDSITMTRPESEPDRDIQTTRDALLVGRQLGADAIVVGDEGLSIFNIGPEHARLGQQEAMTAAIAEVALELGDADTLGDALRALAALRQGRPLAAAYWFEAAQVSVDGAPDAAALRLAELAAASSGTQWTRVALFEEVSGPNGERLYYYARALAAEGNLDEAISYAERARAAFERRPDETKDAHLGRASMLLAHLHSLAGDDSAASEASARAIGYFDEAGDALRQADAERAHAGYLYRLGQVDEALAHADLARGRYYHNGARYDSALTEVDSAHLFLEDGRFDKAIEMAQSAAERLEAMDEGVGIARARLVESLAERRRSGSSELPERVQSILRNTDDPYVRALAAAALIDAGRVDDTERLRSLAASMQRDSRRTDDQVLADSTTRSLAALCIQGIFADDAAQHSETSCDGAIARAGDDPRAVRAWVEHGWRALRRQHVERVDAIDAALEARLEALRDDAPVVAAHTLLFRYAAAYLPGSQASLRDSDELIAEVLGLLEGHSDDDTTGVEEVLAPCDSGRDLLFSGQTLRGRAHLEVCAAHHSGTLRGALASLLADLHDDNVTVSERAQRASNVAASFKQGLSEAEASRLSLIRKLATPTGDYSEEEAADLLEKARQEQTPQAVAAYVDYLMLQAGRIGEATAFLDANTNVFYRRGEESPGVLVRLRLGAMVLQLQPAAAARYAQRALSEVTAIAPDTRARIEFLLAQNEIVAGRWERAAEHIDQARQLASDPDLVFELEEFAADYPAFE